MTKAATTVVNPLFGERAMIDSEAAAEPAAIAYDRTAVGQWIHTGTGSRKASIPV